MFSYSLSFFIRPSPNKGKGFINEQQHFETAPEKISLSKKLIDGLGAFVNNIVAAVIAAMVMVLNVSLRMNSGLASLLSALPCLTEAITDPLMYYISD